MKHLRKFLAALLALAVVLSLSAFAFAAIPTPIFKDTYDPNTLANLRLVKYATKEGFNVSINDYAGVGSEEIETSNEVHAIAGVTFTYYKMADVVVEDSGAVYYTIPTSATELMGKVGIAASDAAKNEGGKYYFTYVMLNEKLAALNSDATKKTALEEYIKTNGTAMTATDASGVAVKEGLAHGMYLIAETGLPTDPEIITETFAPFYVPLPLQNKDGWQYYVTVYPKNKMELEGPDLEKTVSSKAGGVYGDTTTSALGATVYYNIASKLPEVGTESTYLDKYVYVDTIKSGLVHDGNAVTVMIGDTVWAAANYNVTYNETKTVMTITVTTAGLADINANYRNGETMTISYSCKVTEDAILGDEGNENEVVLTWSREGETDYEERDCCHVYTYGIEVTKTFADGTKEFGDVRFTLERLNNGDYIYINYDPAAGKVVGWSEAIYYTPDENGKITFRGLLPGTYRITETATRDGYGKLSNSIEIVITSEESTTMCENNSCKVRVGSATVGGGAVTMLEDGGSVNAVVPLNVVNSPVGLPPTGAEGTWLLSIVGILAMAAAAFVIILVCRKKKATDAN